MSLGKQFADVSRALRSFKVSLFTTRHESSTHQHLVKMMKKQSYDASPYACLSTPVTSCLSVKGSDPTTNHQGPRGRVDV
jgi:hypothetical protein